MRFIVGEAPEHRCCFDAAVYDTQTGEPVCVCFYAEEAERIAATLNAAEDSE